MQPQRTPRAQKLRGRLFLISSRLSARWLIAVLSKWLSAIWLIAVSSVLQNLSCTYDADPPGDARINDAKQLLMIDATGLTAQRAVRIQYTDSLGSTTLQTSAEKTDASGRLLYPLYMTRGTRNYSLTILIDQNGNGVFGDTGDLTTGAGNLDAAFVSDGEVKKLALTVANFSLIP